MRTLVLLIIGLNLVMAAPDLATSGAGAILLEFNTSVRAEGMGGAGVATHWGGDPGAWANPGLLAYQDGVRYTKLESHLVPQLADDIWLRDERVTFGMGGFGLLLAREPVDGSFLDMGRQEGTDDAGNPTGSFESWMKAEKIGVGVSLFQLLESLSGKETPGVSKRFDVSAGYTHIEFEDMLAPDEVLQDGHGGGGSGKAYSYGALARFTPLNTIGSTHASGPLGGVRISLAYGMSVLNNSDEMIEHVDALQADPFPTMHVKGWSAHVETGFPPDMRQNLESTGLGWLVDSLTPLISFGYADQTIEPGIIWDADADEYLYEHDTRGLSDENSTGWELTIANVWSMRRGHRTAPGQIDGDTEGSSLGFTIGGIGGVRWDKATVPQATGLGNVEREAFTVWVDLSDLID